MLNVLDKTGLVYLIEKLDIRYYVKGVLSKAASSGSYEDLINKPKIPANISELTNDSNFMSSEDVNTKIKEHDADEYAHKTLFSNHNSDTYAHMDFNKATNDENGQRGMVPAPAKGQDGSYFLSADGTWKKVDTISTVLLNTLYPIGSIKITVNSTAPFEDIGFGTWIEVGKGRVLWGGDNAGSTIEAGLPQHTHSGTTDEDGEHQHDTGWGENQSTAEAPYGYADKTTNHYGSGKTDKDNATWLTSAAGKHTHLFTTEEASNSIYGQSDTVQPPAYVVHFWQRTK